MENKTVYSASAPLHAPSVPISVIVPIYNAEPFLDDCIRSLLEQTFRDFELLLINDGSTDASLSICQKWQRSDPRIQILDQPNRGVAAARNRALDRAAGTFLAFVDADDWVEPDYLTVLYGTIGDTQLAVCGVEEAAPVTLVDETIPVARLRQTPSLYAKNPYLCYSVNKLYRADILARFSLRMPEQMHRGEDVTFVERYLEHCETICATSQVLYHYRHNQNSVTHTFCATICEDESFLMSLQYNFFHETPLTPEQEEAFAVWEHGKTMAVLRNIVSSAPSAAVRRDYLARMLQTPHAKHALENPPASLGPRSKLYAPLARSHAYGLLGRAIQILG